jgi:hypothetical protein
LEKKIEHLQRETWARMEEILDKDDENFHEHDLNEPFDEFTRRLYELYQQHPKTDYRPLTQNVDLAGFFCKNI